MGNRAQVNTESPVSVSGNEAVMASEIYRLEAVELELREQLQQERERVAMLQKGLSTLADEHSIMKNAMSTGQHLNDQQNFQTNS